MEAAEVGEGDSVDLAAIFYAKLRPAIAETIRYWQMQQTSGSDLLDSVAPRDNNSTCVLCI